MHFQYIMSQGCGIRRKMLEVIGQEIYRIGLGNASLADSHINANQPYAPQFQNLKIILTPKSPKHHF